MLVAYGDLGSQFYSFDLEFWLGMFVLPCLVGCCVGLLLLLGVSGLGLTWCF